MGMREAIQKARLQKSLRGWIAQQSSEVDYPDDTALAMMSAAWLVWSAELRGREKTSRMAEFVSLHLDGGGDSQIDIRSDLITAYIEVGIGTRIACGPEEHYQVAESIETVRERRMRNG